MPLPFDNMQASLALTQFIPLSGIFPSHSPTPDPNVDPGAIPLGSIRTFAGNFAPGGSAQAGGHLLPINQNTALFSLLGTIYGGNGTTNFALPDLDGQTMIGAGQLGNFSSPAIGSNDTRLVNAELPSSLGGSFQPIDNYQASLPLTYLIRTGGLVPVGGSGVDFIGQIVPFAGNFVPDGFLQANGQEVLINDYPLLFSSSATNYGGDGNTTFARPDLTGRTAVGATLQSPVGGIFGQETSLLLNSQLPVAAGGNGQPVDNHEPSASITYLIAAAGIFPPHDSGAIDPANQYLGEIVAVASDASLAPNGWFEAKGQLLPINQHQALFSLLGTMYGGNGQTTFALPDLRDRAAIGTGDEAQIAHVLGSNTFTLLPDNIPERLHDFNGDILWRHDSGQVYFWEMDGLGIKAEGSVVHAAVPNDYHIQGVGDFDGDGKSDILWRHDSGQVYIWEMVGLNVKAEGIVAHAPVTSDWHVQSVGAQYGDSNSDILWRNDNGQVYVWEMNGLQIKAEGGIAHAAVPNDWHILA